MDIQIQKLRPNYKQIYLDILSKKCPHKEDECEKLLEKKSLSALDIIELNKKIFGTGNQQSEKFNQSQRSYDKSDILQILNYQKEYKLNNTQLAIHFKLSRNTVAKWKKMFIV